MNDAMKNLYETVLSRKAEKQEGSYTCYLFEKGLDKILKKCGEECSEVIIAAKNGDNKETVLEISDFLYHLMVLMVEEGNFAGRGRGGTAETQYENRKSENFPSGG